VGLYVGAKQHWQIAVQRHIRVVGWREQPLLASASDARGLCCWYKLRRVWTEGPFIRSKAEQSLAQTSNASDGG